MIDVNEAKTIIEKSYNEYPLSDEVIDIGKSYVFTFETGTPQVPGICPLEVDKESGNVSTFFLPDAENFKKLEKGKTIKL